jgi:hypothetical protein
MVMKPGLWDKVIIVFGIVFMVLFTYFSLTIDTGQIRSVAPANSSPQSNLSTLSSTICPPANPPPGLKGTWAVVYPRNWEYTIGTLTARIENNKFSIYPRGDLASITDIVPNEFKAYPVGTEAVVWLGFCQHNYWVFQQNQ